MNKNKITIIIQIPVRARAILGLWTSPTLHIDENLWGQGRGAGSREGGGG